MKSIPFYILITLWISFSSCNDEDDGGPRISVTHDVDLFAAIELMTASDITIHEGFDWSVVVDGKESDVNDTEVFVSGSTLIIRENGSIHQDQHITIFTPFLYSIKSFGSSNVSGEFEAIENVPVHMYLYGSGNIEMQLDTADVMYIKNFGSGDMTFSGLANRTEIELTGSGWVRTFLLPTISCNINLTGSGSTEVHVDNDLNVFSSGSGDVLYKGHPIINSQISGSGKLIDAN